MFMDEENEDCPCCREIFIPTWARKSTIKKDRKPKMICDPFNDQRYKSARINQDASID